ncbi:unnamed protein product [Cunninghamella blakesleeana]
MNHDIPQKLTPQAYLEIAFIYAFSVLFDESDIISIYSPPHFTPKSLEEAIYQDNNELLDKLMCCFLSNALNRKKLLEVQHTTRPLYEYINSKIRSNDFNLDHNPLTGQQTSFQYLTSDIKLKILHALVEWQLQDSTAVRAIVDHFFKTNKNDEDNPLMPIPFGYDQRKRAYWRFGESPYLWCENPNLKKGCEFEIVCTSIEELQQFGNTLINSRNNKEKTMGNAILNELLPELEEKQRRQERKDRMKARQLATQLALEEPKVLPKRERRKPVRYNFNEDMDIDDDDDNYNYNDDSQLYNSKKKRIDEDILNVVSKRRPLRSSGRLNGGDAITDYMSMDTEQKHLDNNDHHQNQNMYKDAISWPTPPEQKNDSIEQYTQLDEEIDIM